MLEAEIEFLSIATVDTSTRQVSTSINLCKAPPVAAFMFVAIYFGFKAWE